LENVNCASFILTTILNSGGTFESSTKLQKIAFLSIYENGMEAFTEFKWHHYGPYSNELQDAVDVLSEEGLIIEESLDRVSYSGKPYTVKRLSLTPKGRIIANSRLNEINSKNKTALFDTIDKYGNKPLSKILEYVYNAYSPEDL
jgi:uncharacterized protein YwgA